MSYENPIDWGNRIMSVTIMPYPSREFPGKYDDSSFEYTLRHKTGASFSVINFGATITRIQVPDRSGAFSDILLGYKNLDRYLDNRAWHGATVGRSANRIKGAEFTIDGVTYRIPKNDGDNNLHGGTPCFQNVFWNATVLREEEARIYLEKTGIRNSFHIEGEAVRMDYLSPDGACGFPGNLSAQVLFAFTRDMTLLIVFSGISDAPTVFSPTNHAYFNLAGEDSGSVSDHVLFIDADTMTDKAVDNVPNGEISAVRGTVFDFTVPSPVGKFIGSQDPQIISSQGLDQNFCLNTDGDATRMAAYLTDPKSGRKMEVFTNFPGLQVYTGNHLTGESKGDQPYGKYGGICLETQLYPDAVHHKNFPAAIIPADRKTDYLTGYRFCTVE